MRRWPTAGYREEDAGHSLREEDANIVARRNRANVYTSWMPFGTLRKEKPAQVRRRRCARRTSREERQDRRRRTARAARGWPLLALLRLLVGGVRPAQSGRKGTVTVTGTPVFCFSRRGPPARQSGRITSVWWASRKGLCHEAIEMLARITELVPFEVRVEESAPTSTRRSRPSCRTGRASGSADRRRPCRRSRKRRRGRGR